MRKVCSPVTTRTLIDPRGRVAPLRGVYDGAEGAVQHALGYLQTSAAYQGDAERDLAPTILDVEHDQVLVLWRQRAVDAASGKTLDLPAASIYELLDRTGPPRPNVPGHSLDRTVS